MSKKTCEYNMGNDNKTCELNNKICELYNKTYEPNLPSFEPHLYYVPNIPKLFKTWVKGKLNLNDFKEQTAIFFKYTVYCILRCIVLNYSLYRF